METAGLRLGRRESWGCLLRSTVVAAEEGNALVFPSSRGSRRLLFLSVFCGELWQQRALCCLDGV